MKLNEFNCHNLEQIKKDYEVTDLVAQVIESNNLSQDAFKEFDERIELDLNNHPELQPLKAQIERCHDENEKIIILSSHTVDNLFAAIIFARLCVIKKIAYTLTHINKDETMVRGNILILGETIRFLNKAKGIDIVLPESYLANSGIAYLISSCFANDRYALALACMGTIASNKDLIKENRTLYHDGKQLLEDQRYKCMERVLISREKRNQQLLYNGRNYTPYSAGMIRRRFVYPLDRYLEEHADKRFVGLLQYFFNPNKEDKKYQLFGTMLNGIDVEVPELNDNPTYIETNLDLVTIDNVRALDHTFEPYHAGFNRPHWVIRDVEVAEYRKFDMARGLELSFRTNHGLVKASAYENECVHVKINNGDHVTVAGTLSINGFSGLPMLHMKVLENLSNE